MHRDRDGARLSPLFFAAEETFVRAAVATTIFRASGMSRIIIATAYRSVRRRRERITRYTRSHDRARNYTRRAASVAADAGLVCWRPACLPISQRLRSITF